ncbi:MAG: hypothetical protein LBK47_01815 [Prevotellaceae bacterium]|jgi:hypothetical protein|nr:hypothetical protein [Prevotellaceae bacterium]
MKKFFLLYVALGLVALSCSKEPESKPKEEVLPAVEQPDVVQQLSDYDNMQRYMYAANGMELFAEDLQLTQQQLDDELKAITQIYAQQPLVKTKPIAIKSMSDEEEFSINEIFGVFAEMMATYSSYQGASEQWTLASNDLIGVLGGLSQKMVEASVVVNLETLVKDDLLRYQDNLKTKYDLSDGEVIMFSKMLTDLQIVLTSEPFLLNIQNSKIEVNSNPLTKGVFSKIGNWIVDQVKGVVEVVIFAVSTIGGGILGTVICGPYCGATGAVGGFIMGMMLIDYLRLKVW